MVKTQTDLQTEVDELIQVGIDHGQVMSANSIVQEVVERLSDDPDFQILCTWAHVRDTVRACLRAYKDDPVQSDEQLRLPGYEFLQKAYLIDRDGEQKVVPLTKCTDEELQVKIIQYRRMSEGCIKHANELERYRMQHFSDNQ